MNRLMKRWRGLSGCSLIKRTKGFLAQWPIDLCDIMGPGHILYQAWYYIMTMTALEQGPATTSLFDAYRIVTTEKKFFVPRIRGFWDSIIAFSIHLEKYNWWRRISKPTLRFQFLLIYSLVLKHSGNDYTDEFFNLQRWKSYKLEQSKLDFEMILRYWLR